MTPAAGKSSGKWNMDVARQCLLACTPHKPCNSNNNKLKSKIQEKSRRRDATKQKKRGLNQGRLSVNEGFGKDYQRKDNSLKTSRPFSEPLGSRKIFCAHPFPEIQLLCFNHENASKKPTIPIPSCLPPSGAQ